MNKIKEAFRRFMYGRYGNDRLNQCLLIIFLICTILDIFISNVHFSILFTSWNFIILLCIYFRMFSRNISKRYEENQRYLVLENRVRSFLGKTRYIQQQRKEFHIYTCPQCKQKIRIPRGKGRISVRCPKCGTEFVKNS